MSERNRHVVGIIFARGGSKGVPRKNLRTLLGKPLIAYSIEAALASASIDWVVVSTDDAEIADTARQYGADVPFLRPAELARDDSPEWLAWQHAVRALTAAEGAKRIDAIVSLPPTSPLRSVDDIDRCVHTLFSTDADIVVTVRDAERSPYFNMVVLDADGGAHLVIPPVQTVHRRQDAPRVYDMTTVAYAARPAFVLAADSVFAGRVMAVVVPSERAIDIDTELDFLVAECLISRARSTAPQPGF